jgi:hypothetical protein
MKHLNSIVAILILMILNTTVQFSFEKVISVLEVVLLVVFV